VMRLLVPDSFPDGVLLERKWQPTDAVEVIDRPVKSTQR